VSIAWPLVEETVVLLELSRSGVPELDPRLERAARRRFTDYVEFDIRY
jgi:hypothetical protein